VAVNSRISSEQFKAATYKPDGTATGPAGTLDILVEDGRGGIVAANLPITVQPDKSQVAATDKPALEQPSPKPLEQPGTQPTSLPAPSRPSLPPIDVAFSQRPIWEFTQQQAAVASSSLPGQRLDVDAWVDRHDQTYRLGEPITVSVRSHATAYITVLNFGTSGRMTVVFPNQFQQDNLVHADQVVQVPPADAPFRLFSSGPAGIELLQVVASDHPLSLPEVARLGMQKVDTPFASFGRSAEEVAHDLVVQLSSQSGTTADARVSVSKIVPVRILPANASDAPSGLVPVPGFQPAVGPLTPAFGAEAPLIVSTDKTTYHTGDTVQVTVVARQPCDLTLLTTGPSGAISQLFPNAQQPATTLQPGQVLMVPPLNGALQVVATAPEGIETIVGVCSRTGSTSAAGLQPSQTSPGGPPMVAGWPDAAQQQASAAFFITQ
jgi:hypothetical protein